ncbi:MAG: major facilitator transporter [Nevskia sp.]|nr:major facilitator transporter [Nevskia sp.]
MPLPIIALALAAFGIGTTEFVIMGLLPEVAKDLAVSIPSAGLLVTGYALGVAVGAPILAVATARLPRKAALLGLAGIFIVGNLLCAIAPNYAVLMAARVLTAFSHGAFFGIGAVVASSLVPPDKRAGAVALMFTGLTLANVLGVPFGTGLGQALGWRSTFWGVTGIGIIAALAIAAWVPAKLDMPKGSLLGEFRVLRQPQVWMGLGMSVLGFGGTFTVFTYIAPIFEQVSGFTPHAVTWLLLLFGVGITFGNWLGGRIADWKLMPGLIGILATLSVLLFLFAFAMHAKVPAAIVFVLWGAAAFATVPPLQVRIVDQARDAPNLASTLNIGAFNIGNAGGAWLGGVVIAQTGSLSAVPVAGAAVALAGLGLTIWSAWRERSVSVSVADGVKQVRDR